MDRLVIDDLPGGDNFADVTSFFEAAAGSLVLISL
jgi:hypothetical protein